MFSAFWTRAKIIEKRLVQTGYALRRPDGTLFHFGGEGMPEVFFNEVVHQIYDGGDEDGHEEFVGITDEGDGDDFGPTPVLPQTEGDDNDDEAVYKLGHEGGTCGAEPYLFFACHEFYFMKDVYIEYLAYEECNDGTGNDPHALTEYLCICFLCIGDAFFCIDTHPPVGRYELDGPIGCKEGKAYEHDGEIGKESYTPHAIVFVDDVCHDKDDRP